MSIACECGPETLGYETSLWTTSRVAHLIEQECGLSYHPSQAWRILRQLGWSCQRPTGRALERDEEKTRGGSRSAGRWPQPIAQLLLAASTQ